MEFHNKLLKDITQVEFDHLQVMIQIKCLRKISKFHSEKPGLYHVNTCSYCHSLSLEMMDEFNNEFFNKDH